MLFVVTRTDCFTVQTRGRFQSHLICGHISRFLKITNLRVAALRKTQSKRLRLKTLTNLIKFGSNKDPSKTYWSPSFQKCFALRVSGKKQKMGHGYYKRKPTKL